MRRFGRAPVRAQRRDASEPEIIAALEAAGLAVDQQEPPRPDLLVSSPTDMWWLEVKDFDPDERTKPHRRNHDRDMPPSLTPQQVAWWRAWIAAGGKRPVVVLDAVEALAAVGAVATINENRRTS